MQTEEPYWMEKAYEEAIAKMDLGLVTRNLVCRDITKALIEKCMDEKGKFLDYGGGYGLFVRLMRDVGFDFYRHDIYCDNVFAKEFDLQNVNNDDNFELLTAFEVFEHLTNPMQEINNMVSLTNSIFFSTELPPPLKNVKCVGDWWYFAPETGQHVAFYSAKTLQVIADSLNMQLLTDGKSYHLLTKKKVNPLLFKYALYSCHVKNKLLGKYFNNKHSLLQHDSILIKQSITSIQ
jgi:hypothetical protein